MKCPAVAVGHARQANGPLDLGATLEVAPSGGGSILNLDILGIVAAPRALTQPLEDTTALLGYSSKWGVAITDEESSLSGVVSDSQRDVLVSLSPLEGPEVELALCTELTTAERGRTLPMECSRRRHRVAGPAPGRGPRWDQASWVLRLGRGPILGWRPWLDAVDGPQGSLRRFGEASAFESGWASPWAALVLGLLLFGLPTGPMLTLDLFGPSAGLTGLGGSVLMLGPGAECASSPPPGLGATTGGNPCSPSGFLGGATSGDCRPFDLRRESRRTAVPSRGG